MGNKQSSSHNSTNKSSRQLLDTSHLKNSHFRKKAGPEPRPSNYHGGSNAAAAPRSKNTSRNRNHHDERSASIFTGTTDIESSYTTMSTSPTTPAVVRPSLSTLSAESSKYEIGNIFTSDQKDMQETRPEPSSAYPRPIVHQFSSQAIIIPPRPPVPVKVQRNSNKVRFQLNAAVVNDGPSPAPARASAKPLQRQYNHESIQSSVPARAHADDDDDDSRPSAPQRNPLINPDLFSNIQNGYFPTWLNSLELSNVNIPAAAGRGRNQKNKKQIPSQSKSKSNNPAGRRQVVDGSTEKNSRRITSKSPSKNSGSQKSEEDSEETSTSKSTVDKSTMTISSYDLLHQDDNQKKKSRASGGGGPSVSTTTRKGRRRHKKRKGGGRKKEAEALQFQNSSQRPHYVLNDPKIHAQVHFENKNPHFLQRQEQHYNVRPTPAPAPPNSGPLQPPKRFVNSTLDRLRGIGGVGGGVGQPPAGQYLYTEKMPPFHGGLSQQTTSVGRRSRRDYF